MAFKPQILALAGSTRKGSYNKQLLKIAVAGAEAAGAKVVVVDLADYPMPLYDQDLETAHGLPENAKKLKALMRQSHGFLIATPEYNSSISAVLKNAIDWASRQESKEEPSLECFNGKIAALMSASPGPLGGLRALTHLRALLQNVGVIVLPDYKCIPKAHEALAADGSLVEARQQKAVGALGKALVDLVAKMGAQSS